jgi:hypothetical protein
MWRIKILLIIHLDKLLFLPYYKYSMDMNGIRQQLQAEATRRASGQPASTAGLSANPSASNPMTARANMGTPTTPTQGDPFGGASQAMNGSMPAKGGTMIEKALIKRMNMYAPA